MATINSTDGENIFYSLPGVQGEQSLRMLKNLSDLTDVVLSNVQIGDILSYDTTSGKWKNFSPSFGPSLIDSGTF